MGDDRGENRPLRDVIMDGPYVINLLELRAVNMKQSYILRTTILSQGCVPRWPGRLGLGPKFQNCPTLHSAPSVNRWAPTSSFTNTLCLHKYIQQTSIKTIIEMFYGIVQICIGKLKLRYSILNIYIVTDFQ
jgi:hypothetical protein